MDDPEQLAAALVAQGAPFVLAAIERDEAAAQAVVRVFERWCSGWVVSDRADEPELRLRAAQGVHDARPHVPLFARTLAAAIVALPGGARRARPGAWRARWSALPGRRPRHGRRRRGARAPRDRLDGRPRAGGRRADRARRHTGRGAARRRGERLPRRGARPRHGLPLRRRGGPRPGRRETVGGGRGRAIRRVRDRRPRRRRSRSRRPGRWAEAAERWGAVVAAGDLATTPIQQFAYERGRCLFRAERYAEAAEVLAETLPFAERVVRRRRPARRTWTTTASASPTSRCGSPLARARVGDWARHAGPHRPAPRAAAALHGVAARPARRSGRARAAPRGRGRGPLRCAARDGGRAARALPRRDRGRGRRRCRAARRSPSSGSALDPDEAVAVLALHPAGMLVTVVLSGDRDAPSGGWIDEDVDARPVALRDGRRGRRAGLGVGRHRAPPAASRTWIPTWRSNGCATARTRRSASRVRALLDAHGVRAAARSSRTRSWRSSRGRPCRASRTSTS